MDVGRGRLRRPGWRGEDSWDQDEGDATTQGVPSPHNPTPAPTGTKALPKRHDKIPTRESPTPAPTGQLHPSSFIPSLLLTLIKKRITGEKALGNNNVIV